MSDASAESTHKSFNIKIELNPQRLEELNFLLSKAEVSRIRLFNRFISDILDGKIVVENKGIIIYEPAK